MEHNWEARDKPTYVDNFRQSTQKLAMEKGKVSSIEGIGKTGKRHAKNKTRLLTLHTKIKL